MAKKEKPVPSQLTDLGTERGEVTLPQDFREALERNPLAKEFFTTLSYNDKQHHVRAIEGAKTAETRQRCVAKAIRDLHQGRT